jgi:hypothetical protein
MHCIRQHELHTAHVACRLANLAEVQTVDLVLPLSATVPRRLPGVAGGRLALQSSCVYRLHAYRKLSLATDVKFQSAAACAAGLSWFPGPAARFWGLSAVGL